MPRIDATPPPARPVFGLAKNSGQPVTVQAVTSPPIAKRPPITTKAEPVTVQRSDIVELGLALRLSQVADERGLDTAAVAEFPDILAGEGLPSVIPKHIVRLAHTIHRDRIDAMLWRCNGKRKD